MKTTGKIMASIDIGSNSVLLLIGRFKNDGSFLTLANEANVTSLGKDLDQNKKFLPQTMEETLRVLGEYKKIVLKHGLCEGDVLVSATEASRIAENAESFYLEVKQQIGFSVQIISPQKEAYYSALGASLGMSKRNYKEIVVMDIGGASTEFILMQARPFKLLRSISLPIGVVRMVNWKADNILEEKWNDILERYKDEFSHYQGNRVISVAGTMTSLAAMALKLKEYKDGAVHEYRLSKRQLEKLKEEGNKKNPDQLLVDYPFLGKRSITIGAGAELACRFSNLLDVEKYIISVYGLRYGTIFSGRV